MWAMVKVEQPEAHGLPYPEYAWVQLEVAAMGL